MGFRGLCLNRVSISVQENHHHHHDNNYNYINNNYSLLPHVKKRNFPQKILLTIWMMLRSAKTIEQAKD